MLETHGANPFRFQLNASLLLPFTPHFHTLEHMAEQKINLEQVRHVAKLARLAMDEPRLLKLSSQLESILAYVAKISEVDVTGVEPMAHALPISNVFREDIVEPSLPLEKVLQNAPETDGPFFKVPKVIGGDEDSAG
jgi:aspartyl-tRNA(Asn)/glutamyl-tRNA(Gln) amidotransferase subunit C